MSPRHRRYLLLEQGIGSGIFNLLLNAAIAWVVFRGATTVPLWGEQSIGGDTIITAFMLPFLTTLIASRVVRRHVRKGNVPAFAWNGSPLAAWLPSGLTLRGALLGILGVIVAGIPTMHVLGRLGIAEMSFGGFIAFKALFAAVLATIVTPLIARAALADA
jgi:hypothetical protein